MSIKTCANGGANLAGTIPKFWQGNPNGENGVRVTTIKQIKAKGTISVSDDISFRLMTDVLNEVFNCSYKTYQRASWFPNGNNGDKYVWFPKLSLNGQPVADEWDNCLSDEEKIIRKRRILTKERDEAEKLCKGNESHYNNPSDCIKANKEVPPLSPEKCKISYNSQSNILWHHKKAAVFAKINDKYYKFFGIYEFIGIQTEKCEKIMRKSSKNLFRIKDKYIEMYRRINEELIISEWALSAPRSSP